MSCLKGTYFVCPCEDCMREQAERPKQVEVDLEAQRTRIESNVNRFWTSDLSGRERAIALTMFHAGYDDEPTPLTTEEKQDMAACGL